MKLNRSYLFVPAVSSRMFSKALESQADCVIFDLEDAVALSEKETARERVKNYLLNNQSTKEVFIRMNDFMTDFWRDDLEAAIKAGATGVIVPKTENAFNIKVICETAQTFLERNNKNIYSFSVIPLIETARGVHFAFEIASAHFFVKRLAFGSIDYTLDLDCELTKDGTELLYARSQIVNASKAAGIGAPIDAVYPDLDDEYGLINDANRAKKLGFKAKLLIHPKQIQPVHPIFTPSQIEIQAALDVVSAFEKAEQKGIASITVGSRLVDYPVYKKAKELLKGLSQ